LKKLDKNPQSKKVTIQEDPVLSSRNHSDQLKKGMKTKNNNMILNASSKMPF